MRDDIDPDTYRLRLLAGHEQLMGHGEQREQHAGTVELDQTRPGRLSRVDALQAQAAQARAEDELRRIAAALGRIGSGNFGFCTGCHELVAAGRLDADPAAPFCSACAEATD